MTRVLVVTPDVLRARMAGPAMRAWHISERLAEEHEVRLLTTSPYCEVSSATFLVAAVGPEGLAEAEDWCDVMILQGYVMYHHPVLATSQKIIVFDIYSPLHLETLALTKGASSEARDAHVRLSIETLNHQLERGDFLICASERQRDLFIGQLCVVGRANALTYDPDPTLRRLIDVVPFGLPDGDPEHHRPAIRGVVPGIGPDDDILIWAGGVYDWFDPLTLIRAVARASTKRPSVRLYFMGLQHPNPDVPPMQMAIDAKALAEELGVAGKHVFFNDGWVEYSERQNFLLEATLGVSTHFESIETRFSFRTRALDYLWAGLPIVATEGDSFGQLIEEEHLGLTVPPEDPQALEEAVLRLLSDPEMAKACRARVAEVRKCLRWSVVLEPLAAFCREPRQAADLPASRAITEESAAAEASAVAPAADGEASAAAPEADGAADGPAPKAAGDGQPSLIQLARHHYQEGGLSQVANRAANKLRRFVDKL
ncbi:MAG TPA: glycosyltransferase family 4 protein [Acidimicrobiales bacterium]|nr:glycosyltransferase family 4 protein [Acidimicrobiales bacterium]